jgi:hypothetical protein
VRREEHGPDLWQDQVRTPHVSSGGPSTEQGGESRGHRLADLENLHGRGGTEVPTDKGNGGYRTALLMDVQTPMQQDSARTTATGLRLDPRRPTPHENLWPGLFRNPNGLLIKEHVSILALTLSMDRVAHEATFLKDHIVILNFMKKPGTKEL